MKHTINILYFVPLVFSLLNVQAFLLKLAGINESIVQAFAYLNVLLIFVAGVFWYRYREEFAPLIIAWFFFYVAYYFFALLANFVFDTEPYRLLPSFIPVIYLWGFGIFLSNEHNRKSIAKVFAWSFFLSSLLIILFYKFNISLDVSGVSKFDLNRSGGVYGDANNACLSALLGLIFIKYVYQPKTAVGRVSKFLAKMISIIAIILTFSKTGLLILLIILIIMYRSWFDLRRILITIIAVPAALLFLYNQADTNNWLSTAQEKRVNDIISILTFDYDDVDFSERDVLLANMMDQVEKNPLIGNGVQFGESIRGHNTILGVWADAGIFTFLFFIGILGYYFIKSLNITGEKRFMILCIILTICVYMLSLQTIINQAYLMVVFVYCAYEIHINENIRSIEPIGTN